MPFKVQKSNGNKTKLCFVFVYLCAGFKMKYLIDIN
jgi:hypothetical protein